MPKSKRQNLMFVFFVDMIMKISEKKFVKKKDKFKFLNGCTKGNI